MRFAAVESDLEVDGGVALGVDAELVVLAGQDGVEQDAHDGGDGKAGQRYDADLDGAGVVDADGEHQDQGGNDNVAGVGEVDLVLDHISHADGRDHTVEDEADTADGGAGHGGDEGGKLRAEGEDDRKHGGQANDAGIIDLAQGQNAGVLAIGGVGRGAEESGQGGGKTVAQEGAMQAGVDKVIALAGGGDGAHIADMLNHGGKAQGHNCQQRGGQQRAVDLAGGEEAEHGAVPVDGKSEPLGGGNGGGNIGAGGRINDDSEDIGHHYAQQDGDDLDHALAVHVGADDHDDGDNGDEPVGGAVGNCGGAEVQADGDDDGAGDDGREKAHDLLDAVGLEERGKDGIHDADAGDAAAGIDQQVSLAVGGDGGIARDEGEGGAQERRDLLLGDQVEQQRTETGKQHKIRDHRGHITVYPYPFSSKHPGSIGGSNYRHQDAEDLIGQIQYIVFPYAFTVQDSSISVFGIQ